MILPKAPVRHLGSDGEDLAATELAKRGYRILARNLRYRVGEIDILAEESGLLVAVEVKTRTVHTRASGARPFRNPSDSVNARRLRRLENALEQYCAESGRKLPPMRIDVVEVLVSRKGTVLEIHILRDVAP